MSRLSRLAPARLASLPGGLLLPAGGIGLLAVLAFVFLVILRPSAPLSVRETPRPTAPPPSHNAVINSFFQEVRDPEASFAVTVKATIRIASGSTSTLATVSGAFQIAGNDYSGTLHIAGAGIPTFDGSVVQIGQEGWARLGATGKWTHAALPAQADTANPFQWISTVDEVTYLAQGANVDGQRTHRLQTTKWLSGTAYDSLALSLVGPQRDSLMEVVTTDAGVPLTATYQFSLRGGVPGGAGRLTLEGNADYTFSDWGKPVSVTPPA